MKRLIFIFNGLLFSGAEMMTLSSSKYLSDKFSLEAVETSLLKGNASKRFIQEGFTVHHIQTEFNTFSLSSLLLLSRSFYSLFVLFSSPNTVVHVHTERYRLLYCLLARLSGCKVLTTIHHIYPLSSNPFKRYLQVFIRTLRRKILQYFRVCKISNSLTGQELELFRYRSNNKLFFNWYSSHDFFYPNPHSFSIAHFLELPNCNLSTPLSEALNDKSIDFHDYTVFLSLGASRSYKNYSQSIKAFDLFSQTHPSLKILYLIVGYDLNGTVASHLSGPLNSNIAHLAGLDNLMPLLNRCHILFMPSLEEGFGIACVEAVSSGLFPLLSDVPALCDFKPFIQYGVWAKSFDSTSLSIDLKNAYDQNLSFSHEKKLLQSQVFIDKFSIESNFTSLIKLYSS